MKTARLPLAIAAIAAAALAAGCDSGAQSSPAPTTTHSAAVTKAARPTMDPTLLDPATYNEISQHDWELIVKDPDSHKGERVVVYGKVTQFDAATGTDAFRMDAGSIPVDEDDYDYSAYSNTVVTGNKADLSQVVRGDYLKLHAVVAGAYSYDTQIGGSTTVPALQTHITEVTGSSS